MNAIPVIDLALPHADVAAQVYDACTSVGFFYVVNHGVGEDVTAACFEQCQRFFSQADAVKRGILADANNRGYTPYQEETLDPTTQREGDTKEGLYFGREVPKGHPEAGKPLHGPNQWPSSEQLPDFRTAISAYFEACTALGFRLLDALARSLDTDVGWLRARFAQPMLFLRPLHYSATRSSPEDGVYGAGAHTDYGMLTILATDGTPGLQVLRQRQWVDVPAMPGAFIINLGDMAERWTNGAYRSTMHRVVSTSGTDRFSLPFFFEPSFDTEVRCLASCCSVEAPRYPPVTAGQHLLQKYAATHAAFDTEGNVDDGLPPRAPPSPCEGSDS